jgi:hypothetical protein
LDLKALHRYISRHRGRKCTVIALVLATVLGNAGLAGLSPLQADVRGDHADPDIGRRVVGPIDRRIHERIYQSVKAGSEDLLFLQHRNRIVHHHQQIHTIEPGTLCTRIRYL